ncbi:MAG: hypothetical protein KBC57_12260 [Neisseriaceae bacterium]|nr:hypothetical protein [Neisseriaceae bacterium]MBP6863111.1 hypothetical protein [Neisseriaceae bacterium]
MTIRQYALLPAAALLAISLTACSGSKEETLKEVTSSDGAYTLSVGESYQDKIADKAAVISARMPGTPADKVTLLQMAGNDERGNAVYGLSMPIPAGASVTIKDLSQQVEAVSKSMSGVKNMTITEVEGADNQATYSMENDIGGVSAFEVCRLAVGESQIFTVCALTQESEDHAQAEQIINSIKFN